MPQRAEKRRKPLKTKAGQGWCKKGVESGGKVGGARRKESDNKEVNEKPKGEESVSKEVTI